MRRHYVCHIVHTSGYETTVGPCRGKPHAIQRVKTVLRNNGLDPNRYAWEISGWLEFEEHEPISLE